MKKSPVKKDEEHRDEMLSPAERYEKAGKLVMLMRDRLQKLIDEGGCLCEIEKYGRHMKDCHMIFMGRTVSNLRNIGLGLFGEQAKLLKLAEAKKED